MQEYKVFLAGKWVDGQETKEISYPYDGKPVFTIHLASEKQVKEAVERAHEAFKYTKNLTSQERSEILYFVYRKLKEREREFAEDITRQNGKPIRDSLSEVRRAQMTFQLAAEEAKRLEGEFYPLDLRKGAERRWAIVRRFPIGIIAAITPFNFPLNLVAHKVAPAVAAGNPVIVRPATQTAVSALKLGELLNEAGYPEGGVSVVPCSYNAASALLQDERVKMLTFTGSAEVGWELKKKVPRKKVTLELGGNAAVIVEPDCNREWALKRIIFGAYAYAGQVCISVQRVLVHSSIFLDFLNELVEGVKKLKVGDPMKEETDVGPVINDQAAKRIEDLIKQAKTMGARVLVGGKRSGRIITPAVLTDVTREMAVFREEVFAPLMVVMEYSDLDEAIEITNDSRFGLQAGIFTRDVRKIFKAFEEIEVGGLVVNDVPTFRVDHMIYGGVKDSGFGREGVKYTIQEMTEPRLMVLKWDI